MKKKRPLIFVTNDDSIYAKGIRHLIAVARELGDVVVVAPDKPQSGMSHALTVSTFLRLRKLKDENGYLEYTCSGTPVDCLKLALHVVLNKQPDIILSGINHGSNASVNVIYSGTMAVAREGAMQDIPSVGFSLCSYESDADFEPSLPYVKEITEAILKHGLPRGVCLNVNVPAVSASRLKGMKVVRQAKGNWKEEFMERLDPHGRPYYWLIGEFEDLDNGKDTDEWALANDYISVVPIGIDNTAYEMIPKIKNWKLKGKSK
ncbi:MAG: 5'/3'-nucleotidase SurE [Bacteroidota bacterium]